MQWLHRPQRPDGRGRRRSITLALSATMCLVAALLAVPAFAHTRPARVATATAATHVTQRTQKVKTGTKVTGALANLPRRAAVMSCAALAKSTHEINGIRVQISENKVG